MRDAISLYQRYREISERALWAARDEDYSRMAELLERRNSMIAALDDHVPQGAGHRRALDILVDIARIDREIERHLVATRDSIADGIRTLEAYAGRDDLSVGARAYDRRG